MKNIKIYFIILLMFGFLLSMGQAVQPATETKEKTSIQQEDPKLSPEEQALRHTAGQDNPSKIDESTLTDPKIHDEERATEEDFGLSNAKPSAEDIEDPRLTPEAQVKRDDPSPMPFKGQNQPEGEKAGTITDYRNLKSDGAQPEGEKPAESDNYRDMQGPRQQPEGDKPGK
jgi:hypothetical protein